MSGTVLQGQRVTRLDQCGPSEKKTCMLVKSMKGPFKNNQKRMVWSIQKGSCNKIRHTWSLTLILTSCKVLLKYGCFFLSTEYRYIYIFVSIRYILHICYKKSKYRELWVSLTVLKNHGSVPNKEWGAQVVTKIARWKEGLALMVKQRKDPETWPEISQMTQTASGRVHPSTPQGETSRKPS